MATLSQNTRSTVVNPLTINRGKDTLKADTKIPQKFDNSKNITAEYIATIGDLTYKLSRGEILLSPMLPEVRCSTRKFSQVRFLIADERAELFAKLRKEADVTVSIGFVGGKIVEKFKGKIKNIGRVEPIATLIIAIDNLAQLGNNAAAPTNDPAVIPSPDGRKTEVDRSKRNISKVLSYTQLGKSRLIKGAKLLDNTIYDSALPLVFSTAIAPKSTVTISVAGSTNFVDAIVVAGAGGATNTLVLSEGAYTRASALPNKEKKAYKLEVYTEAPTSSTTKTASSTEQAVLEGTKLKYSKQTPYAPSKDGSANLQETASKKIVKDANLVGGVVIAKGNTISEISADDRNKVKSALILDYKNGKSAFFGEPIITVKTPLVVNSGVGTLTINGWNLDKKEAIVATAATPTGTHLSPNLKSFATPTGPLEIKSPVYPGSMYTWGDVTKMGQELPQAFTSTSQGPLSVEEILKGAIRIAQIIDRYTKEIGKGKWQINSWYRTYEHQQRIARKNHQGFDGRHMYGDAVDFVFIGMREFHDQRRKDWTGGVAIMYPSKSGPGFVHLDDRPMRTSPRWTY